MGIGSKRLIEGIAYLVGNKIISSVETNNDKTIHEKRNKKIINWNKGISKNEFETLAMSVASQIYGLSVNVENHFVFGKFYGKNGKEYIFQLDFNDFGKITGDYWIIYDNTKKSPIMMDFISKFTKALKKHKR